jgi:hypothetical protein
VAVKRVADAARRLDAENIRGVGVRVTLRDAGEHGRLRQPVHMLDRVDFELKRAGQCAAQFALDVFEVAIAYAARKRLTEIPLVAFCCAI